MPADDGITAPEIVLAGGKMHRAAFTAAHAIFAPHHFCHERFRVNAHCQGDAMIAVGSNHMVFPRLHRGSRPHANSLMPAVEMQVDPGNSLLTIQLVARLFELTNEDHLAIPLKLL